MVTLMSYQSRRGRRQRDTDADADDGASASATSWFPAALGVAGLVTASTAITCCMCMAAATSSSPLPPAMDEDDSSRCYLLAAGLFYAGIAELAAAVWVMDEPRDRVATGRRLLYASVVPLTAAVGLAVATLIFW